MVGFQILVRVAAETRQEFLHTFKLLTRPDKKNGNCLGQSLFEDVGEANRFLWVEYWADSKAMGAHLETDRFRSLMGAIDVLGNLEELRTVKFKSV